MAALIKGLKFASLIVPKNPALLALAARQAHGWNKDFKPATFPQTEKEREAAARKYGLHPSEYQPLADDGTGIGDYPKLPDVPVEARDPYYPYDFPELKRNLHDTIRLSKQGKFLIRYWLDVVGSRVVRGEWPLRWAMLRENLGDLGQSNLASLTL
ncbi:NADH dehydrogenase [ubiquinone] 1 beta subcomplex subunit 8, mitochondrial-like [Uranotaenia lowii]|uniref:NADH dehydrogenase [ubiquinone] 1 beta subcomplex subunit 8, mitochondrial-like n=1 Tax=Uranotaenia lowii TaxID=190385 RepID=UPI002479A84C|nr:NADH dehydrogenase [ubiquinone] 1 beta subcomplex subunit 8, mitochondrial-like [Uranotaenia lowii]